MTGVTWPRRFLWAGERWAGRSGDVVGTAVHEAGHAIVAIGRAVAVESVDIIPADQADGGRREGVVLLTRHWAERASDLALVYCAGPLAVELSRLGCGVGGGAHTDERNLRVAWDVLGRPGASYAGWRAGVRSEAERVLWWHQDAHNAIVRALLERDRLDGDEVVSLVADVIAARDTDVWRIA